MYRPAGMSDDEDDDDEGFSFGDDKYCTVVNVPDEIGVKETFDDVYYLREEEERELESHVINACIKGDIKTVQEYHEQHDINKNLHTGWTLLLYATSSVEPELVEHLLNHDADPNKHKEGFTPLMALCNSTRGTPEKSLRCLELLLEAKATVNVVNKHRETALMYACKSQDTEFVAELIKHVKDVNVSDSDGKTALRYATEANKPDTVKILLEHKADITVIDRYSTCVSDVADTKGFKEISALLGGQEEESDFCEIFRVNTWKDLFPDLYPRDTTNTLDYDISLMLEGMGLASYRTLFRGMDLETFLQLTEDDLRRLGINISVHIADFMHGLGRFHSGKWHVNSLGRVRKNQPYTLYDGIITLTNAKKQITVIGSSFQFLKNNLVKAASEDVQLSAEQKVEYEKEIRKLQDALKSLKHEVQCVEKLAKKIDKESDIGVPATFIGPEKSSSKWTIITLGVTIMIGLHLCKTVCVQKFWNDIRYNTYF
ncbi:hypothetical protein DMN91_012507 [Ooceraea biroi]|uniref:Ankyrin repeat, SAM and basic leucine zipper domain-containing protein n=1 Tax=Ooceraea biroi TaxID=2015173 RepID=A0A026WER9_OOCBI|nr:ankyrin repeat, SAM and basic leucine zipper domain-containing protein 1 [Ooceraea biroi]EZA54453.1 Ankyrin repeat, SAM and basic leucine zipper domain-containing protein [Ooceraea biroi]RLU15513.1 hypothetical protein DMN91_012507 [Ooceraea biroi]